MSPGTGRLYPDDDLRGLAGGALDGLRGPRSRRERRAGRAEEARTEDEAERRGVGGGDPTGADFLGEGHRKVRARLRAKGIGVGKNRVLRLMRENGLLAPVRRGKHPRGDRSHSGRITTDVPNELWGTDATRFYTKEDGWCWFFVAVDHCVTDVVGWHVAKKGDRWAALEPIRQGVRTHMDGYAPKIALGLGLRHDWGPQTAHQFQGELAWLGIRSTASYVGEPECNGSLHADAEGRVPVPPRVLPGRRRCVHRTLQPRVAPGAARVSTPAQVRQELTLKAA